MNRYHRQYFESQDRKLRLTVEREQSFFPVSVSMGYPRTRWRQDDNEVVELKYALSDEALADHAAQLFPFKLTRHARYARGIDLAHMESVPLYLL